MVESIKVAQNTTLSVVFASAIIRFIVGCTCTRLYCTQYYSVLLYCEDRPRRDGQKINRGAHQESVERLALIAAPTGEEKWLARLLPPRGTLTTMALRVGAHKSAASAGHFTGSQEAHLCTVLSTLGNQREWWMLAPGGARRWDVQNGLSTDTR